MNRMRKEKGQGYLLTLPATLGEYNACFLSLLLIAATPARPGAGRRSEAGTGTEVARKPSSSETEFL